MVVDRDLQVCDRNPTAAESRSKDVDRNPRVAEFLSRADDRNPEAVVFRSGDVNPERRVLCQKFVQILNMWTDIKIDILFHL